MNLQIKYNQDKDGVKYAPITVPQAVRWSNGDNLDDKLSGKEDKTSIESVATGSVALSANVSKYYTFVDAIETFAITLPSPTDATKVQTIVFFMTIGTTPAITFSSALPIYYHDGFGLEAGKTYEVNCLYNGAAWVVSALTIIRPFFAKLTLNDGSVVELQGSGELTSAMVSQYKSTLVSAEIGELCTSIGSDAFNSCSGLTSVTIPDSVTSIGDYAFGYCSVLTSITIGSGVTSIGNSAFYACSGLTSITIPDSVTSIGDYAFNGCTGLTSVTLGSGVTSIGEQAFAYCSGLTSITIPDSVTSIGDYAFGYCSVLTSITIGSGVTSIGEQAFAYCSGLTSITSLATTAPTIQSSTFKDVKTGGTLYVPSGSSGYDVWMGTGDYYLGKYNWTKVVPSQPITYSASAKLVEVTSTWASGLHINAFSGKSGQLTMTSHTFENGVGTITFDGDVTNIGKNAFYYCSGLTSITIPDSVASIGGSAFNGCTGLTSITIPDSVTSIGGSAFYNCTGLTSITIPNSVTSIGRTTFGSCGGLTNITCNATTAPTIDGDTFQNVKTGGTLTVPSNSTGYDTWMGTGEYYLGMYGWTKVEQ